MTGAVTLHTKRCPECKKTFDWDAEFCDVDSSLLDDIPEAAQSSPAFETELPHPNSEVTTDAASSHIKRCPQCSKTFDWSAEFCDHDGSSLENMPASSPGPHPLEAKAQQSEPKPIPVYVSPPPPRPASQAPLFADTPAQFASAPHSESLKERIKTLFRSKGENSLAATAAHLEDRGSPLPDALIRDGWSVYSGPEALPYLEADRWQVRRGDQANSARAYFTRYRASVLTSSAVYQKLRNVVTPHLPMLLDCGTVDVSGNTQFSWDLYSTPSSATPLNGLAQWLRNQGGGEATALRLLPSLIDLLKEMVANGLMPLVLRPDQLAYRTDRHLMLTQIATLTLVSAHGCYRSDFAGSGLLSALYAAPELAGEQMEYSAHCAVFSVGQLLAEAAWGQPCSRDALQRGDVPLGIVSDARLARVLKGCLWSTPATSRWTVQQLLTACDCEIEHLPQAPDWSQLDPKAAKRAFVLGGKAYWRANELLEAAMQPENWMLASNDFSNLLDWLEEATAWESAARLARQQLRGGAAGSKSVDHVLVSLARRICPELPETWRTLSLGNNDAQQSLINLAQASLHDQAGGDKQRLLNDLFDADLRGAFHPY